METLDVLDDVGKGLIPFYIMSSTFILLNLINIFLIIKDYRSKLITFQKLIIWMVISIILFLFINPINFIVYFIYRMLLKNKIKKLKTSA